MVWSVTTCVSVTQPPSKNWPASLMMTSSMSHSITRYLLKLFAVCVIDCPSLSSSIVETVCNLCYWLSIIVIFYVTFHNKVLVDTVCSLLLIVYHWWRSIILSFFSSKVDSELTGWSCLNLELAIMKAELNLEMAVMKAEEYWLFDQTSTSKYEMNKNLSPHPHPDKILN